MHFTKSSTEATVYRVQTVMSNLTSPDAVETSCCSCCWRHATCKFPNTTPVVYCSESRIPFIYSKENSCKSEGRVESKVDHGTKYRSICKNSGYGIIPTWSCLLVGSVRGGLTQVLYSSIPGDVSKQVNGMDMDSIRDY